MKRLVVVSLLLAFAIALSFSPRADAQGTPPCVRSWGEARYGALAYNHIVHLANSCDRDATCIVSTDVNPEAQTIGVGAQSQVDVVTFMGSPSRTFVPKVQCTMQK